MLARLARGGGAHPHATPAATRIAAHRGFHGSAGPPENSIASFTAAIDRGVDYVETDVWRTVDGVLVLHHDHAVGGADIAATRYRDLPRLANGEEVPRVEHLRDLAAPGTTAVLWELKGSGFERQFLDTVTARMRPDQFEVFSFQADSVRAVKHLRPDVRAGVIFEEQQLGGVPLRGLPLPSASRVVRMAQEADADFVAVRRSMVREPVLRAATEAQLPVYVWTANKPSTIDRLLRDSRITTIISDHPGFAMARRAEQHGARAAAAGAAALGRTTP